MPLLPRRALLLAGLAPLAAPALAQQRPPALKLAPAAGAPRGLTAAGGTIRLDPDRTAATLAFSLTYWDLSGPATALRLDGPEPISSAPVVIVFAGQMPAASPIAGRIALTPAQMQSLIAGRYTIAVTTAAFPQGEITGPATV